MTKNAFAAISSIIVIAVVISLISVASSLISISQLQTSSSNKFSQQDINATESCLEDSLLYFFKNSQLPSSVTLPNSTCLIQLNDIQGTIYTFSVKGDQNKYPKYIQAAINTQDNSLVWSQELDLGDTFPTPTVGPSPTSGPTSTPPLGPTSTPVPTTIPPPTPAINSCSQYCQATYSLPGTCQKSKDCTGTDAGKIYECGGSKICCCQ